MTMCAALHSAICVCITCKICIIRITSYYTSNIPTIHYMYDIHSTRNIHSIHNAHKMCNTHNIHNTHCGVTKVETVLSRGFEECLRALSCLWFVSGVLTCRSAPPPLDAYVVCALPRSINDGVL